MQDLYKGFRKTAEDDHSATLEHDNGHSLTIAKSGLSKKQKHALSKLPLHQAKGTKIINEPQDAGEQAKAVGANIADAVANKILEGATQVSTPTQEPQLTAEQIAAMPEATATDVATGQPVAKGVGGMTPEERYVQGLGPQKPVVAPIDVVASSFKPGSAMKSYDQLKQELEQKAIQPTQPTAVEQQPETTQPEDKGLASVAEQVEVAKQEVAKAPAAAREAAITQPDLSSMSEEDRFKEAVLNPNIPPSQKYQVFVERAMKKQLERDEFDRKFYDDMSKEEIKPIEMLHDRSTLGKIGAVIAMAMSGIGAGITGKENMAMQVLNDQINREIDAQKRSQEKKFNLHKFHSEQMGNSAAADLQLANDILNIGKMQLDEQILGWGNNPMARMRAQDAKLAIEARMAENRDKMSQILIQEDQRKIRRDLLRGQVSQAEGAKKGLQPIDPSVLVTSAPANLQSKALEEINHRKEMNELTELALDYFDQIDSMAYTPGAVNSFQGLLTSMVPKIEGRSSEGANEAAKEKFTPKKFNLKEPGANKNIRNAFIAWAKSKSGDSSFRAATNGMSLDNFQSTAHQWAQKTKPASEVLERFDPKTRKVALFDAKTKQFLGYK